MFQAATPHALFWLRRKRSAGVSLVEMMVATMILAILGATIFTSLARLNRNAAINRNYTNAQIILRNAIDQALTRGWTSTNPASGILLPTYPSWWTYGGEFWVLWNPYSASDDPYWYPSSMVPVFSDQMDSTKNVSGWLLRSVHFTPGSTTTLQITFLLEYQYDGQWYEPQMSAVRAMD